MACHADGKKKSIYHSPMREQMAQRTRERILDAAQTLLRDKGYAGMKVTALARMSGVSVQTVYGIFGSKRGVLHELMDRAIFRKLDFEQFRRAAASDCPEEIVRCAASICRQVYESDSCIYDLLGQGARVVDPELARLEDEREAYRYEKTRELVSRLAAIGALKAEYDEKSACDIVWALTSRGLYQSLVRNRGWDGDAFVEMLTGMMLRALIA